MTQEERVRYIAQLKVQLYSMLLQLPNSYYEQQTEDSHSNLNMMTALASDSDVQFVLHQALANVNSKINDKNIN